MSNENISINQNEINSGQLSVGVMMVFVSILTAFPMMATDMYMPALPSIKDQLNTTIELVNLTMSGFFFVISISGLFFGSLSDRFGRKPVIMVSLTLYVAASAACAISTTIYFLIISRLFQAIGCAGGMAVSTAIIKDFFPPEKKEKAFAIIGALTGFVPVTAPILGAWILKFTSWRGAFVVLAFLGVITLIFGLFYKETNTDLSKDSIPASLGKLFVVLFNPSFARLVLLFSFAPLGMMAFVGISSFIFQQTFGLSEQAYSYYFATNAAISVLVAIAYIRISQFIKPLTIITGSFALSIASGILTILFGGLHPMLFLGSIAVGSAAFALQRPPSMNLLIEQQDKNTGSASSLMFCFMGTLGSIGLVIISMDWSNRIVVLGVINMLLGIMSLFFWLYTKNRCKIPKNMR
ncbi:MAG: multidrug effflux MFS transporter [Desulfatiglans sp.]|jgi:DHA1 family bicyclomycin/chloramphenicol resistance-like MFS transporter|nr:multidrug effflux MFS transporter [Desulfatiglans sp.]